MVCRLVRVITLISARASELLYKMKLFELQLIEIMIDR